MCSRGKGWPAVTTALPLGQTGGQVALGWRHRGLRGSACGAGRYVRVVDAWVGIAAVLPELVQFAARFEGADPEWRVDGAQ